MTTTIDHSRVAHAPHPPLTITDRDLALLERCLATARATDEVDALEAELARATIVAHDEAPADLVTLGANVVVEDVATGSRREIRVVAPADADAGAGRISVLAPIGAAVIGLRRGDEIEWRLPRRATRVRIVDVAGDDAR